MKVGVPKEIKTNENRIALVPAGAETLVGWFQGPLVAAGELDPLLVVVDPAEARRTRR